MCGAVRILKHWSSNSLTCGMSGQGTNEIAEIVWNNPNNNCVGRTSEMFLIVFGASSFTVKWKMSCGAFRACDKTWTGQDW